ncbi:MAG: TonB-dependent receptor [Rhodothermales bacterium]|nr:TonB-dependent receptor [Rhodothermales bacterium]
MSPKLGLNYRVLSTANSVTNVYANVSRSFKAPTFDQLFDQRTIPVPFPPFEVSLSSAELNPQYGTSFEGGAYHRFETDRLSGELSLALYQIDMRDEIDFDLQILSYRNLGKSRHRGVEADATIYTGPVTLRGSYAYQETTLRFGEFDGNFVKAIPRDIISAGVDIPVGPVVGSASLKSSRRIFLDDANTQRLPSYTTVDARLGYDFGRATISLEVYNLLDATFSTTGFPDPGGSDAVFVFPFTDRHFRLGANVRLP